MDLVEMLLEVGERREWTLAVFVTHGAGKRPELAALLEVVLILEVALACLIKEQGRERKRAASLGLTSRENRLIQLLLQPTADKAR